MKQLFVHGCSHVSGDELEGPYKNKTPYNIKYRWPTIVANYLKIENILNKAVRGGSNYRIYRETIEYVSDYLNEENDPKELFVLIGWSSFDRIEISYDGTPYDVSFGIDYVLKNPNYGIKYVTRTLPQAIVDLLPHYMECWSDHNYNQKFNVSLILGLQSFLKLNQIKYMFVNSIHPVNKKSVLGLEKQIDSNC